MSVKLPLVLETIHIHSSRNLTGRNTSGVAASWSMGRSAVSRLLQCCGITRGEKTHSEGPKTINIFIGFLFFVNFQMGTGFLGIPFAFFHGGLLAGAGTLVLASFVNWVTAIWVLETLSRAQVTKNINCTVANLLSCSRFRPLQNMENQK